MRRDRRYRRRIPSTCSSYRVMPHPTRHSNDTYLILRDHPSPKVEVWKVIHAFCKWILIHKSMDSPSIHPPDGTGETIYFLEMRFMRRRWINKVENVHADRGFEQTK